MDLNALAISNKLLIGNLQLSLTSIFISIAAYFTGVFGMNLDQVDGLSYGDIQTGEGSFIIVFVCSFTIVVIGFVVAYYYKCKLDQMLPKALT
jgi:Mg2+ and Co2+ transporter CorA